MRKLILEQNFMCGHLDDKVWTPMEGSKWANNELQAYSRKNISFSNDGLVITGKVEDYDDKHFTSARLETREKFEFKYGLVEVVAKLPTAVGSWPAIWLLSSNIKNIGWPYCGEIDIMEHVGHKLGEVFFSVHTGTKNFMLENGLTTTNFYQDISLDFHKFSLDWKPESLTWFVDDKEAFKITKDDLEGDWPFDSPSYLILNMAIGGNFTEGIVCEQDFPEKFIIKSVKVYSDEN